MSENEKLPDENINPSQAGQDMCPARCCCTLSYQIQIFILRDLIKLAFTVKTCVLAPQLKPNPQFSTKHFWDSEANRASGDFCGAESGFSDFP